MLKSVLIDGFIGLAYADIDLDQCPVNVFVGHNGAGKSSLKEAIAFCLRGLSPRVKLKGQFDELVYRGKKNGKVVINLDGFLVERNVKTGKLTTTSPLDYPETLIDLQLSIESFHTVDPKNIRKMLNSIFKLEATTDVLRQRLINKNVNTEMIDRVLPMIKANGFESSSTMAKQEELKTRGKWEQLTSEKYGCVKAKEWSPEELSFLEPEPAAAAVSEKRVKAVGAKDAIRKAQQRLASLEAAVEQAEKFSHLTGVTADEVESSLLILREDVSQATNDLRLAREKRDSDVAQFESEIRDLEKKIQQTRMELSVLECPCCAKPLKLNKGKDDVVTLVIAEEVPQRAGSSLQQMNTDIDQTKEVLAELRTIRAKKIQALETIVTAAQLAVDREATKLATVKVMIDAKEVTADDVNAAALAVQEAERVHQEISSDLTKIESAVELRKTLTELKVRAGVVANEIAQWSLLADALGNSPDSIPSELIARTIGPLNEAMAKLCVAWGTPPVALDPHIALARGDGTQYYLLSESERWRADAVLALSLAQVGPLKLVCLDRFDVLEPDARPAFFGMLERFTADNPTISVLITGTLKSPVTAQIPGVKFWWVEAGGITGKQEAAAA